MRGRCWAVRSGTYYANPLLSCFITVSTKLTMLQREYGFIVLGSEFVIYHFK